MSNFLNNGTVLPFGLLSNNRNSYLGAFNRAYKNTSLRVGVITASYSPYSSGNLYNLTIEYDVSVLEQNDSGSITAVTYMNCMSAEGFGGLADFFERSLRPITTNKNKDQIVDLRNQNGSIVLIQCLDGMTAKGIIIGSLTHPDRQTTLTTTDPHLQGEYNGVQIVVNSDGSTGLTFQGATDNNGNIIDSSQGTTELKIEKDGTFQVDNSEISLRLDKTTKEITLKTTGNWTVNIQGNTNITTQGDTNLTTTGKTTITSQEIDLNGNLSGITTSNSHQQVIDLITGVPVIPSLTTFGDV